METLIILATIILPLLIGYILGRNRDNSRTLFNKKLEAYSNIVYHISSAKDLRIDLDISVEKIRSSIKETNSLQENDRTKPGLDHLFNKKLEEVDREQNLIDYKDKLIKLFAPARLIGSKAVADELREYYSLISERHSIKEKKI